MTSSKKKLYTVVVKDSHNSPAELLLAAANESAVDYSSIYNWKNISVEASSDAPKDMGTKIFYFFDIYGDGGAQIPNQADFAAKEANI